MDMGHLDPNEILELLEACDELNFDELIDDLQNYLIEEEEEWTQQNLVYVHEISLRHQSFGLLQDYCDENPEMFLKSDDIDTIERSLFMSIVKRDDLRLKEIDIWDCMIQWGIGQSEEKLNKDISDWNNNDFIKLKNIIGDIIPSIRFDQISSNDFFEKVKPYKEVIDKNVYEEIHKYHIHNKWIPGSLLQKGPRMEVGKGKLLNLNVKCLISSWIDGKTAPYNKNNLPYKFQLILQGTRDGFSRAVFEDKCYNIEQTIVIMKAKETGELIGGYNPVFWNLETHPPNEIYWVETDKSFIYRINKNQLSNSTLSRVKTPEYAILHPMQTYNYTNDNINIIEVNFGFGYGFDDLRLRKSINNEFYCYYRFTRCSAYKPDLRPRNTYQLLEEYEVYKLIS